MSIKTNLLAGTVMTPAERRMGRFMRAPDGHDGGTPAPAPAATETPTPAATETPTPAPSEGATEFGMEDDFSAFEKKVRGEDKPKAEDTSSGEDVDPATPEEDTADKGTPDPDDQPGSPVQERIDELTAARREAERALAEERRLRAEEREALEARLAKLEKGDKPEEGEGKKTRQPGEEPNPDDYEYGKADSEYIIDMAEYRQEVKLQEREAKAALQAEFDTMEKNWQSQTSSEEVKAQYPDFEDKVIKGADRGDWKLSLEGSLMVRSSPVGAHVAYHLANNPDESARIAQLSPVEQALEIGRIEGRFMGARQEQTPNTGAKPSVSKAPPPPKHTARGAGGRFSIDPATDDFAAFEQSARRTLSEAR